MSEESTLVRVPILVTRGYHVFGGRTGRIRVQIQISRCPAGPPRVFAASIDRSFDRPFNSARKCRIMERLFRGHRDAGGQKDSASVRPFVRPSVRPTVINRGLVL